MSAPSGSTAKYASTPLGREAYGVLDWVFEDPTTRASEGQQKLAVLFKRATDDERATQELGDVGLVLARLQ